MHTAANDNRPASFDALINQYTPGLLKLARKLAPASHYDLYVDTVIVLLHRWKSFRPDGGFWNWASLTMRGLARDQRERARKQPREVALDVMPERATPPSQHDHVELSETLARLRRVKGGRDVLRQAMGATFAEIGKRRGLGHERARQIVAEARRQVAA